jgi:peroxiredoxin Q/BCP
LQTRFADFQALDTAIVAIAADPPERARTVVEEYGLQYPILADTERVAIRAFGVVHAGAGIEGDDIARPASFLFDRDGRVVWRDLTENWRVRARPERILAAARAID